jgi:hypothetical protein
MTPRRLAVIYVVMIGFYLVGLVLFLASGLQAGRSRLLTIGGLASLAAGMTISFGIKAAALIQASERSGARRMAAAIVNLVPPTAMWAVAVWQIRS